MEHRHSKPLQDETSYLEKGKGQYQRKLALEPAFLHPDEYLYTLTIYQDKRPVGGSDYFPRGKNNTQKT